MGCTYDSREKGACVMALASGSTPYVQIAPYLYFAGSGATNPLQVGAVPQPDYGPFYMCGRPSGLRSGRGLVRTLQR